MAPPQKHSYGLVDVVIDSPICRVAVPLAEVSGPSSQSCIEAIPHFPPWCHVPRHQHVSHFLPESGHALLRRTLPDIYPASLPKTMRPECISEKVKPLPASLLDAGLCFVQREANPRHDTSRPIQCLCRATATQDHEIIGVVHDLRLKNLTPSGDPPIFQKTVHVQVSQQRTDDSALWCATGAVLPAAHPRFAVLVPLLDRHL